jgi:hypothetical protein
MAVAGVSAALAPAAAKGGVSTRASTTVKAAALLGDIR